MKKEKEKHKISKTPAFLEALKNVKESFKREVDYEHKGKFIRLTL